MYILLSFLKAYWAQHLVVAVRFTCIQCLYENALNTDRATPVDIHEEVEELGVLDTHFISFAMGNG